MATIAASKPSATTPPGLYGAGTIKRFRMTAADVEQVQRQILAVLETDRPQSIRHIFYRMTDPRLPLPIPKTEKGYRQVQRRLVEMRRAGLIPYGWISDTTRRGYHVSTFSDAGDLITRFAGLYRADLWRDVDSHVEVWCESRSIAGVIEDTCEDLAVSLYPAGGFASLTFVYDAAQAIRRTGKGEAVIVYVGDYDPAGVLIDQKIIEELRGHLPFRGITLRRIAVTEEQIEQYGLPTKPRKDGDMRRLDILETVEAEAMPAETLRRMLRAEIESYLPANALHAIQIAEQSERQGLEKIGEIISQHGLREVFDALTEGGADT